MWAPDPPPSRRPSVSMLLAILFASTTCYLLFVSIHAPNTQNGIQLLTQQESATSSLRSSDLLSHDPDVDIIPNISYQDDKSQDDQRRHHDDEDDNKHKKIHYDDDDDKLKKKIKDDDEDDDDKHKKNKKTDDDDDDNKYKKNKSNKGKNKHDDDDDDDEEDKGKNRKKLSDKIKKSKKKDDHEEEDDDDEKDKKKKDKKKTKEDDHHDDDDKKDKKNKKKHDDDDDDDHDKKDQKNKKNKNNDDIEKFKKSKKKPPKQEQDHDNSDQQVEEPSKDAPATSQDNPLTAEPPTLSHPSSSQLQPYRILLFGDSITVGYGPKPDHPYSIRLQQLIDQKGIHVEMINAGISGNCVIKDPSYPSMVDRLPAYLPISPTNTSTQHQRRLLIELGSSSMEHDEQQPPKSSNGDKFDMVIVLGGTNDIGRNYAPQDILDGVISLHERVRINGAITVAITIPERVNEIVTNPPYLYRRDQETKNPRGYYEISGQQLYSRRMIINEGLQAYCQHHEPMKNGRTSEGELPCLYVDFGHEMPYATDPDPIRAKKLWIDDVHPSPAGYDRMGEIIWDVISPYV